MTTYKIDLDFVFHGNCTVKANSLDEAKQIARENMRSWGASISKNDCDKIYDYESDLHAETIVKED